MAAPAKTNRIKELLTSASAALKASNWFEAERLAQHALGLARRAGEWGMMARIILPLMEARRQRLQAALDCAKAVRVLNTPIMEDMKPEPGVYIVEPPTVGADARRLRLAALRREVPVAVLCREPLTRLKQVPLVAIGETTVRVRLTPPKKLEAPDLKWFVAAMSDLGDAAIEMLDAGIDLDRQIDAVLACLDAVPDHEALHQLLIGLCQAADKQSLTPKAGTAAEDSGEFTAEEAAEAPTGDEPQAPGKPGKTRRSPTS